MNPPAPPDDAAAGPASAPPSDLRHWAARDPQRAAVVIGEHVTTYGELDGAANRLAHLFARHGLQRGEHVAAILPNGALGFALAWAAWRSGVYFTPVSHALSARDAALIVADCEARVLVVDRAYATLAGAIAPLLAPGVHAYLSDGLGGAQTADPSLRATAATATGGAALARYAALDDALADLPSIPRADETPGGLMLYTSGTTGAPKGVWRPLPAPDYAGPPTFAGDLLALFGMDAHTRFLSPAPLYHAAPLRFSLAVTASGGTVVAMPRFDAAQALQLLIRERITHSQWVPTMMQRMLALPAAERAAFHAPEHRVAIHAAAPCPVPLKHAMIDWWGPILLEYYSGSEGVGLTLIDAHEWLRHPGSVGRCRKGVLHIVDDRFAELPPGAVGNVYFSGVAPFQYFKAPEKTAGRTSPQGWQTLGDIGRVDDEGYLYLTDRMDDMIISGGVNLYPQEIESAILESPLVADCGVVGVPDADFGECAVAFVVPRPHAAGDPQAFVQALDAFCRERLGRIKRPARIEVLAELPHSPTGKLLRRELRARLAG
jgi:acyl-CoA synthetase (AMP-forming)/AMP-acid ligase II